MTTAAQTTLTLPLRRSPKDKQHTLTRTQVPVQRVPVAPVVTVAKTPEVTEKPQIRQLVVRMLDGGVIPFRDYVSFEIRDGVLYVFQRSQDTTEKIGSKQVTVTSTLNVMIPMNRIIRLEDKLVCPKE